MFLYNWGGEEGRTLLEPTDNRAGDGSRGISGGAEYILHKGKVWDSVREVEIGKTIVELSSLVSIISNFSPVNFDFC